MKKKILKMILMILTTVVCFLIGREYALYERGYKAVGGEYLIFIIPSIAYLIKEAIKDYKEIRNSDNRVPDTRQNVAKRNALWWEKEEQGSR